MENKTMTKSTITRERVQWLHDAATEFASTKLKMTMKPDEVLALTRALLAAMDSEHHTDDELSNLLWYSQEATCHSDPNYYCEFQRLATPGLIAGIIRELQERRKADSEPVAWLLSGGGAKNVVCFDSGNAYADPLREVTPLYRHAQPVPVVEREPIAWLNDAYLARGVVDGEAGSEDAGPGYIPVYREAGPQPAPVVPEEKLIPNTLSMYAVDAVAAIAEVKGWNACRAATLAAAPQPQNAPQNIPDIIPNELIAAVNRLLDSNGSRGCYSAIKCYDAHIEVERLLAAARQEVKP
ncbi:TPA: hypothetical protein ACTW4K_002887 [Klebsiella quasipneumoniae subsp. similipneumoniae]